MKLQLDLNLPLTVSSWSLPPCLLLTHHHPCTAIPVYILTGGQHSHYGTCQGVIRKYGKSGGQGIKQNVLPTRDFDQQLLSDY